MVKRATVASLIVLSFTLTLCGSSPECSEVSGSEALVTGETLFGDAVPSAPVVSDSNAVELGVKFQATVDGQITAVRFYRGVGNGAGYVAHLWSASGELLASGQVIEGQCTTPCWQEVMLDQTIAIAAGTIYVASYFVNGGNYAFEIDGFALTRSSGHLVAPSTLLADGNGVYVYGSSGGFPVDSYAAANYWVDVRFVPSATTALPPTETLFGDALPANIAEDDPYPVELGMKFETLVAGSVSAIRFFRGIGNGAGYRVHLWSSDGVLLGSGNVVEGQCGAPCWQEVQLVPPVSILPNTTYIASYFSSNGSYPVEEGGMVAGFQVGNLIALDDASAGGNDVYVYGDAGGFPANSWRASNFFVDVRFTPQP